MIGVIINGTVFCCVQANTMATGVILHKDSRFNQSWQEFRENNPYVNRVMEWKTKLNESDHVIVRASSVIKDKVAGPCVCQQYSGNGDATQQII